MALVYKDIVIDVNPGKAPQTIHVSQYDINRQFNVTLTDDGTPLTIPAGTTAVVEGSIGRYSFRENADVSNNVVTFLLSEAMTANKGKVWTKIKLIEQDHPLSTCAFWLDVDRAGVEAYEIIEADGFYTEIAKAVSSYLDDNGDIYSWRGSMQVAGLTKLEDCTANGIYQIPSGYSTNITDLPEDYQPPTSGFVISLPMAVGTWQILGSMRGFWVRSKGSGNFSKWERLSGIRAIWSSYPKASVLSSAKINGIYQIPSSEISSISDLPDDYGTGAGLLEVNSNYATGSAVAWQRLTKANGYSWIRTINTSGTASEWTRIGETSSSDTPYKGLYLSVLGDSISSYVGTVPAGNRVYYNGSNAGVTSSTQMWWSRLCDETGMIPLIINGWSGSCVASGVRNDSDYKPASDSTRCQELDDGTNTPDVVLIAMGVNDWSYNGVIGEWNGKSSNGDVSTFKTAYATMVRRIQSKYPEAYIVAVTPWFCQRGTLTGEIYTNSNGVSLEDFCDAIRDIAKLLHISVIEGNIVGFNRSNYYPTYCEDSSSIPTHPNSAGHDVMGRAIATQLKHLSPLSKIS